MNNKLLDEVDWQILHLLEEDARNNTNAKISERVGVSPSTVGNRITQLEHNGVIKGYQPEIAYERTLFPFHVLFICTTSITERTALIQQVLEISGVVNIRELMTGGENVHIEVVGNDSEDITRLATSIDDLGIDINEEILIKDVYPQHANVLNRK
ncbi:Lrp/AsnC family transcriptional regulator [Haladaptatus sp. NG-SE-30]